MSIRGEKGILYIYQTTWKPIACLTSNGLNTTVAMIESQTKCFPGVVKKTPGTLSYSVDAEGEYIDTTTAGGDTAWKIDTNVDDATSVKYFGDAYITDLSATFGSGDELATFSLTLDGDGAIVLTDPND
jgi:hypothetical protein